MESQLLSPSVMVSIPAMKSTDPDDIIASNISVVNALRELYVLTKEIAPDALRSYFVDFYLAQINNGGFSQFVYNSRWDAQTITHIREGLQAIGAHQHLALFEEMVALVAQLGDDRLTEYLSSEYFGENDIRDELNVINERFFALCDDEDLTLLNAEWLRSLPDIQALPIETLQQEIIQIAARIPNREQRIAEARANEPRYKVQIRELCEKAGHEFVGITAGDPTHIHNGQHTLAWYFRTDKGLHYMVEADGKALMYPEDSDQMITEIEASDEEESPL